MGDRSSSPSRMQPASAREAARFLSQRGYQHAGELLSGTRRPAEIEVKELIRDAFAPTGTTQRRKDIRLALHMHPEEDGEGYVESFRQLNEWLARSSEPLQRELHDFRFPLLLHCFIGLASRGEMETARAFLRVRCPLPCPRIGTAAPRLCTRRDSRPLCPPGARSEPSVGFSAREGR